MNTILVPTDFSPAAAKATAYAAQLAKKVDASVRLLHAYQLPVPMTDYPVLMVTADDLKKVTEDSLQRAKEEGQKAAADVPFETESRLGDVVTEIDDVCKERNPVAVVVGVKQMTGFDRMLFGDTTLSLVKHCTVPVIAVPENTRVGVPTNVVLATDLLNAEEIPAANIAAIIAVLGANLHVVHVEQKESTHYPEELMKAFVGINASYHPIREDDVTEGLKRYVEQNNIDLVLVLPHKHNLYERLFFRGHTKGILHAMPVPVMSLRND
ncbi:universal stress protein [Flavisolibacter nicotianae]|uniref:universal stress protein n=1 Tax=Flavisolibacter nicotianae TaxID=2364882 RepID=UPI000EB3CC93|nr:universal stress protein [Flavisolibacter nicotianae]